MARSVIKNNPDTTNTDHCLQGFYCMADDEFDNPDDAAKYDGCEIECEDNEILMVDPRNGGDWQCIPRLGPMPLVCPGKFNTGNQNFVVIIQLNTLDIKNVGVLMVRMPAPWEHVSVMVSYGYHMIARQQSK